MSKSNLLLALHILIMAVIPATIDCLDLGKMRSHEPRSNHLAQPLEEFICKRHKG